MELKGKTAIVTGGGTGIGAATAKRLPRIGMEVACHSGSVAPGAQDVAAASAASGERALTPPRHVAQQPGCAKDTAAGKLRSATA